MVEENKAKALFNITSELHDDLSEVYELASDGENVEATKTIDKLILHLRMLKTNLILKEQDEQI